MYISEGGPKEILVGVFIDDKLVCSRKEKVTHVGLFQSRLVPRDRIAISEFNHFLHSSGFSASSTDDLY